MALGHVQVPKPFQTCVSDFVARLALCPLQGFKELPGGIALLGRDSVLLNQVLKAWGEPLSSDWESNIRPREATYRLRGVFLELDHLPDKVLS
eukprot:SAG31_NODE_94_length_26208_cov_6.281091_9_plen_93_part_00